MVVIFSDNYHLSIPVATATIVWAIILVTTVAANSWQQITKYIGQIK
jgi:hypothetical protein